MGDRTIFLYADPLISSYWCTILHLSDLRCKKKRCCILRVQRPTLRICHPSVGRLGHRWGWVCQVSGWKESERGGEVLQHVVWTFTHSSATCPCGTLNLTFSPSCCRHMQKLLKTWSAETLHNDPGLNLCQSLVHLHALGIVGNRYMHVKCRQCGVNQEKWKVWWKDNQSE